MDSQSFEPTSSQPASAHRAQPIRLPSNAAESAALVLRFIQTADTAFDRSAAIEAMALRLERLRDSDDGIALAELSGHAALLDALFLRWAAEAVAAKQADHKAKFAKLALSSQASYTRTLIAIEGLKQQRRGVGRMVLNSDGDNEDPEE